MQDHLGLSMGTGPDGGLSPFSLSLGSGPTLPAPVNPPGLCRCWGLGRGLGLGVWEACLAKRGAQPPCIACLLALGFPAQWPDPDPPGGPTPGSAEAGWVGAHHPWGSVCTQRSFSSQPPPAKRKTAQFPGPAVGWLRAQAALPPTGWKRGRKQMLYRAGPTRAPR